MQNTKSYSKREEKANYLTHAFGVLLAVAATVVLLHKAIATHNGWAVLAYGPGLSYYCNLYDTFLNHSVVHYKP